MTNILKQFSNTENPRLEQRVHITFNREILVEDDSDLSFLGQDYADTEDEAERKRYLDQDRERLAAYERGDWHMTGVRVVAHVLVPIGGGSFRMFDLASAGLWGVESDASEEYLTEIEAEEKADLIRDIKTMGEAFAVMES